MANYIQECYENGKIVQKKGEFMLRMNDIPYLNLSSREAKLIQLFRGHYRDCDLYIIDEPLNDIDKGYAEMSLEAMKELF